ncbi:MAG: Gfo/Idh/MocA family oxidoreductase, partial [Clostridia bacterium]|nr:Gfo/Idh/MocA family oxidoreductase [Clostridia bacterium]
MATKRVLKMGFVGVGPRARSLMKKVVKIPGAKIVGIYDPKKSAVEKTFEVCETLGINPAPKLYESSDALFADKNIDAVIIAASWAAHIPLACAAMKAGKIVGLEVGPAMSLQDCFTLVEVQEQTQAPFMFLENGCYKRNVLHALNMVKEGLFGELIHLSGGY